MTKGRRLTLHGWIGTLLVMVAIPSEAAGLQAALAVATPFTWSMAGVLVKADRPLQGTAATLLDNHFSYIGQYGVNGCANNNAPYSCAANGCNYPGDPKSAEIPSYASLRDWMVGFRDAGLYVGLWGQAYTNAEAEGHCMAEVLNTMRSTHGVTAAFFIVAGEKSFETFPDLTRRFVDEFNRTITFDLAKAEAPECVIDVDYPYWLSHGFTSIMPQAYWNEVGDAGRPSRCLNEGCLGKGVPRNQCQVMLDGHRNGTPHGWAEYADQIQAFGGRGFSIWMGLEPASEWDQWRALIETRSIAVYDGGPPPPPTPGACPPYTASNTANATRNFATCAVSLSVGQQITLGTCGVPGSAGTGDTYLRLFRNNTQVAANDDACGDLRSRITYTAAASGTYTIREGCFGGTSCGGTVAWRTTGGCSNACSSGQKQCLDGDAWQECGNWDGDPCLEFGGWWSCAQSYPGTTCSNGFCVGTCANECSAGQKRCLDGDAWQECGNYDADQCLEWGGWWSCAQSYPGTTCSNGFCVGGCANDCTAGQKRCRDADAWEECGNYDADVCLEWGGWWSCAQSYPGTTCSNGYCVGGCSNECGAGQKRCLDGDAWQECGNWDGDACLEWGGWWSCAQSYPGTTCSNGYCVGGCSNECGAGQKRCLDGDAWQECGNWDGDACLEWGGWWSCAQSYPGTHCSNGYCGY